MRKILFAPTILLAVACTNNQKTEEIIEATIASLEGHVGEGGSFYESKYLKAKKKLKFLAT